jgi:hypothetical protein
MIAPIDSILSRLQKVRLRQPGQWSSCCPAHEDKSPSLSVRETPDGAVLLYCFAGCEVYAIVTALGMDISELFPPRKLSGQEPKRIQRLLTTGQALELLDFESNLVAIAAANVAKGITLTANDLNRIKQAAGRVSWLRRQSGVNRA